MEQLFAAFGINWKLLLIQGFNFGLLLIGLLYFLYKPVMKMLDERAKIVAQGVKDAEEAAHAKKETESAKVGIISSAEREAEKIVAGAINEGKEERAGIVKSAQERAEQVLRDAELQAAEAKRRSLSESQKDIARLAVLAAEKVLKES